MGLRTKARGNRFEDRKDQLMAGKLQLTVHSTTWIPGRDYTKVKMDRQNRMHYRGRSRFLEGRGSPISEIRDSQLILLKLGSILE